MDETEELKKKLRWYEDNYGLHIEKRGFHNWRNLFRKPTLYEWTILLMLVMGLFIAWTYQRDISICRAYINQQESDWETIENKTVVKFESPPPTINFSFPGDVNGTES